MDEREREVEFQGLMVERMEEEMALMAELEPLGEWRDVREQR